MNRAEKSFLTGLGLILMPVFLLNLRVPEDTVATEPSRESLKVSPGHASGPAIYLLSGSPEEAVRLELDGPLVAERWSKRDFGLWESVPEFDFETPTWAHLE